MKKITEIIQPWSWWQFLLANASLALVIVLVFMRGAFESYNDFFFGCFWAFTITITQWTGLVFVNWLLDRKIRWVEQPILRSVAGIISLVGYSVFAFLTVKFLMFYILYRNWPEDPFQWAGGSAAYTLLISFIMSLIGTAIGFFKAWKRALLRAEKLKTEMMAYKYESLRNQINPHFLFNSFNVLSDLVYADQKMAVTFIRQLSVLFRYVLDSRDKELVPLKEELDFIHSFVFLLKTRFEDKLTIEFDLQAATGELIVPMTLQLLVENAVKHNEVSESFPLTIHIRRNGDYLEVENTLQLKNVGEDAKSTGLQNIRQQFDFFTDRHIEVIRSEKSFLVRVPILMTTEK